MFDTAADVHLSATMAAPPAKVGELGLGIVDEQHRFGVHQRLALQSKGRDGATNVLVMTATPIPRTLLMTHYGDLDVSILDELPAGRGKIITAVRPATKTTDAAMNLELVDFVRSDRKSEFAGSSGDRTAGSFRAALGRAEVEQKLIRVVGEAGVFDVTGVIDASTDDHIVMRDPQGHEWLLPRTKAAFAVVGRPTPRSP